MCLTVVVSCGEIAKQQPVGREWNYSGEWGEGVEGAPEVTERHVLSSERVSWHQRRDENMMANYGIVAETLILS